MITNKILKQIWSLFYAVSITTGLYIAIEALVRFENESTFTGFAFILLTIFLVEIYITWQYNVIISKERIDAKLLKYELLHMVHKVLLPMALFGSIVGYSYYNFGTARLTPILVITFGVNYVLFLNIRAYFEHRNQDEHNTHYVFDIIKFLIFFTCVNALFNNGLIHDARIPFLVLGIFVLTFMLTELLVWRLQKQHLFSVVFATISGVIITSMYFILVTQEWFNALQSTLILTILFYFIIAGFHHYVHKTLTNYVLVEYLLVFVMLFGVLYGTS